MQSINRVLLAGVVAYEPKRGSTEGGAAWLRFVLATTDMAKDGRVFTERHNVAAFGSAAENGGGLREGSPVVVEGRLEHRKAREGEHWETTVKADRVVDPREAGVTQERDERGGGHAGKGAGSAARPGGSGAGVPPPPDDGMPF